MPRIKKIKIWQVNRTEQVELKIINFTNVVIHNNESF